MGDGKGVRQGARSAAPRSSVIRHGADIERVHPGEVMLTSSGRATTPFPKWNKDKKGWAARIEKAAHKWWMQNALDEAESRGDRFNATTFRHNLERPSPADLKAAEMYLFGEQPPVIRKATRDAGVTEAPDETLYQFAFHGSPYRFDEFLLEHIGSGEGNQSFGWGLYFAGRRGLSEEYRRNTSRQRNVFIYKGKVINRGDDLFRAINNIFTFKYDSSTRTDLSWTQAKARAIEDITERMNKKFGDPKSLKEDIDAINKIDASDITDNTGQLYRAEIPEDDVLLDWDKPISEQPEKVKAAINEIVGSLTPDQRQDLSTLIENDVTGEKLYQNLSKFPGIGGDKATSLLLNEHGIQGIRYNDIEFGERTGFYNYVVFDDDSIEILETYYQNRKDRRLPEGVQSTPQKLRERLKLRFGVKTINALEKLGLLKIHATADEARAARDGEVMNQALKGALPKGWRTGNGKVAAAMWRGHETADAVRLDIKAKKLAGDIPGSEKYSHSVSQSALKHIRNRHGEKGLETRRGQIAINDGDIESIPAIIENYDAIRTDLINKNGNPVVAYAKRTGDGVVVYLEEVGRKRMDFSALSMWKYPAATDVQSILQRAVADHYAQDDGGHKLNLTESAEENKLYQHIVEKISLDEISSKILDAIKNSKEKHFGLRVIPNRYEDYATVGKTLKNSVKWIDGRKTDIDLGGVSSAGILQHEEQKTNGKGFFWKEKAPLSNEDVIKAINNLGVGDKFGANGIYAGNKIVLVGGSSKKKGNDVGESVIKNGKVIAVFAKDKDGRITLDPDETLYQSAYNGSPYRFDKFLTKHIGSGEGNQAFGWGLYFADRRELSEGYRKKVSRQRGVLPAETVSIGGRDYDINGDWNTFGLQVGSPEFQVIEALYNNNGDKQEAIAYLERIIPLAGPEMAEAKREAAKLLKSGKVEYKKSEPGQLYKVDIPEDDVLLDWDKPLSEQPEQVREVLNALYREYVDKEGAAGTFYLPPETTGEKAYKELKFVLGSARAASEFLNSLGIQGIRYLDGNSRSAGEGSHNYVVFDDNSIEILETYYQQKEANADRIAGAKGFFDGEAIHLVAENLTADEVAGTLLHEFWHRALKALKFDGSPVFAKMMDRLSRLDDLAAKNPSGAVEEWFVKARASIPEADRANRERYLNELGAYAINEYENAPRTLPQQIVKWVEDFIADIRAFLTEHIGYVPKTLKASDLSAIARRMMRNDAGGVIEDVSVGETAQEPILTQERAQELANLSQTMRPVSGSTQAKAVRGEIVGKPLTNLETGIEATVSGESWLKMMSRSNVERSVSSQAHMQALGNIDTLFRLATLEETRAGKKPNDADTIAAIRHFVVPMPFEGQILQARMMVKELRQAGQGNRIYLVEAVEIDAPASIGGDAVMGETDERHSPRPADASDIYTQMAEAVNGRAQPLSAKVLTPDGFRRMGDILTGDEVIAADGSVTLVDGVFPQGEQSIYRMTLSDGSSTRCTADHLWMVRRDNEPDFGVFPLHEIMDGMKHGERYEIWPVASEALRAFVN